MPVTLENIVKAADVLSGNIVKTPCVRSQTLSEVTGTNVFLKFENHQFTASFKDRGALNKLLSLSKKEQRRGVVAMSAGNHAQAVAYHAKRLGIPATIVMPHLTPNVKVERTRAFGAEVILHGKRLDQAHRFTEKLMAERGLCLIHPYDDEKIIAGQGTIAVEMLDAFPDLEILVVPVGGGGLVAGTAIAAKGIRPEIEVVGVQTDRFPAMQQALQGKPVDCGSITIAEGIAVKEPGHLTLPIIRERVDEIFLVGEKEIEAAVLLLLEVEKTVVEGAGAVGLAALLDHRERFEGKKVGFILSGGNIDLLALSSIIRRGLVRSRRMIRLRVGVPDVPGGLADVTRLLKEAHANIVEIRHQRAFSHLSLRWADVEFVLETLGPEHVRDILEALRQAHFKTSTPDIETL
ncbi:MAG: threonine ammonia-lyase [Nitrospiria bacterium]